MVLCIIIEMDSCLVIRIELAEWVCAKRLVRITFCLCVKQTQQHHTKFKSIWLKTSPPPPVSYIYVHLLFFSIFLIIIHILSSRILFFMFFSIPLSCLHLFPLCVCVNEFVSLWHLLIIPDSHLCLFRSHTINMVILFDFLSSHSPPFSLR